MPLQKGANSRLILDYETTYGSDPASPAGKLMPFNTFGVRGTRNLVQPKTMAGTRNPVPPILGFIDCKGNIEVPIDILNFGRWLKGLLGSPVTTGSGPYTHTFKVPSSIPSMVLEIGHPDVPYYLKYNGSKLESMTIDFGGDNELTAKFDVVAAKETGSTTSYSSNPTTLTFNRFGQFQLSVQEGGSASNIIGEASITIKNNLDDKIGYTIGGGGNRTELPEGLLEVSGRIKALFTNTTLYTKAINSTESSLKITATSGTSSLEFFIPELIYKQNGIPVETPTGIYVDLEFMGYYQDNSDQTSFKVVLINSQNSY